MEVDLFVKLAGLAALAVTVVEEILKLKIIPFAFANRYPVPTNILLSLAAAGIVAWNQAEVRPDVWTDWVLFVGAVSVVAAVTYNMLFDKWKQLRAMEGSGKSSEA